MQVLSRQRGISLIEVMVAIIVFSVGVLGVAMLQLKGAQFSKQAGIRTVAVLQARSLADAMRANPAGVYGVATEAEITGKNGDISGSYYLYDGTTVPSPSSCGNPACSTAKNDLLNWLQQLKSASNAAGMSTIQPNTSTGTLTVKATWSETSPGAMSNDVYQFDYQP
ncbi:type IV pilus modification protein PilV [Dyella sp. Tek66A03]|uniref:type IV pilus modification protein PilV n=1 Tax=Dyella sp. Tek66A03 TaxID=3458298 RepID=UPI00403E392C